jgi:hypothetical protein
VVEVSVLLRYDDGPLGGWFPTFETTKFSLKVREYLPSDALSYPRKNISELLTRLLDLNIDTIFFKTLRFFSTFCMY